jgi:Zn-dependent protease with chaperone function
VYSKIAKIAVWSSILAFIGALLLLVHSMYLDDQKNTSTAALIIFALWLPIQQASHYIFDPVGKAIKDQNFVEDQNILARIQPLLDNIDSKVRVGYYESPDPNAFAISSVFSKHSAIAFSTALLKIMSPNQFMAIAAHEVAHIKNADSENKTYVIAFHHLVNFYPSLISQLAKGMIKQVFGITLFFVAVLFILTVKTYDFAGVSAALLRMLPLLKPLLFTAVPIAAAFVLNRLTDIFFSHYSRQRELAADADGAAMTSKADLREALQLLSNGPTSKMGFFDSHPPMSDRLRRLQ